MMEKSIKEVVERLRRSKTILTDELNDKRIDKPLHDCIQQNYDDIIEFLEKLDDEFDDIKDSSERIKEHIREISNIAEIRHEVEE